MSWTDYETNFSVDFTVANSFLGKPRDVLNSIRTALNERAVEVGVSQISGYLAYSLDAKFYEIYDEFIDHTQATAGKFSNITTLPLWTLVNLETEIGRPKPIISESNPVISTDWVTWIHEALNLLIWVPAYRTSSTSSFPSSAKTEYETYETSNTSWQQILDNWSGVWDDVDSSSGSRFYLRLETGVFFNAFNARMYVVLGNLDLPSGLQQDIDFYLFPIVSGITDFDDFGYSSLIQDRYSYVSTTSITSQHQKIEQSLIDPGTAVLPEPTPSVDANGFDSESFAFVRKLDVANGFEFY